MSRHILIVLSELGFWEEAPVGPLESGLRHWDCSTDAP